MKIKSKSVAFIGIFTALAMIFAYVEALIPPLFTLVPGIKMGLPNIIIVFLLYRKGPPMATIVSFLRIILVSILFGNAVGFLYSLAGGLLSLVTMVILRRFNILSTVGVSVAGGVAHNIGQILMAMLLLETAEIAYYLAVLTITGTISGVLIGLCGAILIKRMPRSIG